MHLVIQILTEAWRLLQSSAIYVIFGMVVAGCIRVFFGPSTISRHLGHGKVLSVVKAALLGIPVPL